MPSYPLTADRINDLTIKRDVISLGGGPFLETRRARGTTGLPKREWQLFHDHLTISEWRTLLAFFEGRLGKWKTFDFTDPETLLVHTVRFDEDVLKANKPLGREINQLFVVTVKIKEVL